MTALPRCLHVASILAVVFGCGTSQPSVPIGATEPGGERDASSPTERDAGGDVAPSPRNAVWSELPSLPAPQQEVAVVALAGRLYVIGGFDAGPSPTTAVNVYDPKAKTWSAAAPLPEALHHVNAAVVGGRIWVVGALRGLAFTAVGTTLVYDPGMNAWSPSPSMPAGTERGSSYVGAIGETIYVAGGLRSGAVADFSSFDTKLETWTTLPPLDSPRDHGMSAVVEGRLYAIGGRASAIGSHVPRVDVFDPATKTWSSRAPMPTSRGGGACAVIDGLIVVAGGEGDADSPRGVFSEVEAYDPSTDAWTSLPAMRTPRHGTGAATIENVVYVPGGGDVQAFGATAIVEGLVF